LGHHRVQLPHAGRVPDRVPEEHLVQAALVRVLLLPLWKAEDWGWGRGRLRGGRV